MNAAIPAAAIVLAAGKSSRMGGFKPLLPVRGTPMLAVTIHKLLRFPFEHIVCVTGHRHEALREAIHIEDRRFAWLHNPDYESGQSSSLRLAAAWCPGTVQAAMIFLADQPFIEPDTIGRVLAELERRSAEGREAKWIVQPSYQGRKGHPVMFSKAMLGHFAELEGDVGAKTIMKYAGEHILVPVNDEGVVLDLDTMEDYTAYC